MKKMLFALVAAMLAFSANAVEIEYIPDSVCPYMEGFHYPDRNIEDITSLIDFLLSPYPICETQIIFIDINGDGLVNIDDVTCLTSMLLGTLDPSDIWPFEGKGGEE